MEASSVVEKNNEALVFADLARAEQLVAECVILATEFFRCAIVTKAHNMLRNGKSEVAVRAVLVQFNGFADTGYDEP